MPEVGGSSGPETNTAPTVTVRLFASARQAAGTGRVELTGGSVAEVLGVAVERFGVHFGAVVAACRVWVDGEAAEAGTQLVGGEEVAILPPVSGGGGM